ncbi:MAG: leader peptidase (prepilin peptidase) / N-methyltransferase [Miltoncostaeaceae bacterium]|nr:leader peptidase (prepilin peptidase) / N-methyltransferase [Miltoncostaeaceae bacterium]
MSIDLATVPLWFWSLWAGLVGLAAGSFFTVAASRWPKGESLVRPRSHCTGCQRTLNVRELIPVLSWALQRGRCRGCGSRIGWRYPAIELASGILAAGAIAAFGPSWRGVAAALLGLALVPVVVIDLEHRLIPDVVVLPAAALGLVAAVLADPGRWWVPAVAAGAGAGFLLLLWLVYPGGMGLGDVKLALLMGAVLGASVIPALALAFVAGSVLGIVLLIRVGSRARKIAVPFGPFLAAGALVALFWGPSMIDWYSGRIG